MRDSFLKRYLVKRFRKQILNRNLRLFKHNSDDNHLNYEWSNILYNRIAAVNSVIASYKYPPSYLEIGCLNNDLFSSIPTTKKIGVDPVSGGTFRSTSDEFFLDNKIKFDVIFIDGLHTFDQIRRDIQNSLKFLNQNGTILMHDMLPRNWIEQHVPVLQDGPWTGDVWKVSFELIKTSNIQYKILEVDHGVGIIRKLTDDVEFFDDYDFLKEQKFKYFYDNFNKLSLIKADDFFKG